MTKFLKGAKLQFSNSFSRRALALLMIILFCCTCARKEQKYANVFYWNLYTGVTSLDPAFARSLANIWSCQQLYNGLIQLDEHLKIKPCIAKNWTISEDGLTYTFTLRNDVYFHDHELFPNGKGRKVTASDFKYSFNRIIDPATASPGAWIFNNKVVVDSPFKALNDTTFCIRLQKPFAPFLSLLTTTYCSVVPKELISHYGKDFRAHPIGTGPFFMKYYYEGEKLILHKNQQYFEFDKDTNGKLTRLPFIAAVDISFIDSKQNEFFSFMQGKLDLVNGIDQSFKDNVLNKDGTLKAAFSDKLNFEKSPFLNTEYFGFLVDSLPKGMNAKQFKMVRQAMNYALDRTKMMRYIRNSIGIPGIYGFIPPDLLQAEPKIYYPYLPGKAAQLLRDAGFPNGKGLPIIKLSTTANYLDLSIFVQHAMEDAGIPVQIENIPSSSLSEYKSKGKSLFFRGSWVADYPDAENYLSIFYSKNRPPDGPNYFHYHNIQFDQKYDSLINKKDITTDPQSYSRMQDLMMEEAPVLILYYDETVRLLAKRVHGLHANPINSVDLKYVQLN